MDLNSLIESVIGAAFEVSNTLGAGFLEKLYERALVSELALRGIAAVTQAAYPVAYKGQIIGEFQPDLVVEDILIVELKCVDCFAPTHLAQCLSYLQASGLALALLLNFQHPKVQCRRVVREFELSASTERSRAELRARERAKENGPQINADTHR